MRHTAQIGVALVAIMALAPAPAPGEDRAAPGRPSGPPVVAWAVERFAEAGLELPAVVVEFHTGDRTPCGGNTSVAVHGAAVAQVVVCVGEDASGTVVRRALLHELAHVWAREQLDGTVRDAFVQLRGATSWNDGDTPWSERGSEQAAEIVTWALMDRELVMVTLADHEPGSLVAAYRWLTGTAPPRRRPVPAAVTAGTAR